MNMINQKNAHFVYFFLHTVYKQPKQNGFSHYEGRTPPPQQARQAL